MMDEKFTLQILECMSFSVFIEERGLPFRELDIFDEVYANIVRQLLLESSNTEIMMQHIADLAAMIPFKVTYCI